MNRRDFIKKSAIGTCAFVIGQGLVFSSCKKENPVNLTSNGETKIPTNGEPATNGENPADEDVPRIDNKRCISCGTCVEQCNNVGVNAIRMGENGLYIDGSCVRCGACEGACPLTPPAIIIP